MADPLWFLALLALPAVVWLRGRKPVSVLLIPFAAAWHRPSLIAASRWPAALALAGLGLVIAALARPQRIDDRRETRSQGHDIVLAIDLSSSMLSEDYEKDGERMNRLQAIKPVIQAFIELRPGDRIGIVLFSRQAYTLSPLTTDHDWLSRQLQRVKIGLIEDGTAIGDALGVALSRLQQGESTPRAGPRPGAFIVLLTDGANNYGSLAPIQAAALAKARSVPIYTIGAGKDGIVPYPVFDEQGHKIGYRRILADLDENALRDISTLTGGHFFRAADTGTIESAFRDIDQGEKIEFAARSYLLTTELFPWLAGPALVLLSLSGWLARPRGRSRPGPPIAGRAPIRRRSHRPGMRAAHFPTRPGRIQPNRHDIRFTAASLASPGPGRFAGLGAPETAERRPFHPSPYRSGRSRHPNSYPCFTAIRHPFRIRCEGPPLVLPGPRARDCRPGASAMGPHRRTGLRGTVAGDRDRTRSVPFDALHPTVKPASRLERAKLLIQSLATGKPRGRASWSWSVLPAPLFSRRRSAPITKSCANFCLRSAPISCRSAAPTIRP